MLRWLVIVVVLDAAATMFRSALNGRREELGGVGGFSRRHSTERKQVPRRDSAEQGPWPRRKRVEECKVTGLLTPCKVGGSGAPNGITVRRPAPGYARSGPSSTIPSLAGRNQWNDARAAQIPFFRRENGRCPVSSSIPARTRRYVRRDDKGRFDESDDVGRSLAQDQKRDAEHKSKKGEGDREQTATEVRGRTVSRPNCCSDGPR